MNELTQRQIDILKGIIEEYIETAKAIGSETLEKKCDISASPATIRNEMVRLTQLGYVKKLHSSAGRVPTPVGLKFYVKQLMKEKELSVAEGVVLKDKVWNYRGKENKFLKELVKVLADKTKNLAVILTSEGDYYFSGYANILSFPEFFDIDVTRNLLEVVDEYEQLHSILSRVKDKESKMHVLIEDDFGPRLKGPYGMVFTHYHTPMNLTGDIGIIGSSRFDYAYVIPTLKYISDLIEEIAEGW